MWNEVLYGRERIVPYDFRQVTCIDATDFAEYLYVALGGGWRAPCIVHRMPAAVPPLNVGGADSLYRSWPEYNCARWGDADMNRRYATLWALVAFSSQQHSPPLIAVQRDGPSDPSTRLAVSQVLSERYADMVVTPGTADTRSWRLGFLEFFNACGGSVSLWKHAFVEAWWYFSVTVHSGGLGYLLPVHAVREEVLA